MTENTISWGNISVSRHSKTMLSDLMEENQQLKERIKELESENKMLKVNIGRNESYIKRLTMKGKWSNTGDD